MTLKITESNYLNELMSSERFLNSSLLDKIDFLNRARASKKFWSYGLNWVTKIIDDQPTRSVRYPNIRWKDKTCSNILLYKDVTTSEYMIQYPTDTEVAINNSDGPVVGFDPNGKYRVSRSITRFLEYNSSSPRYSPYAMNTSEHTKFLRYLKSVYENSWLNLKREKVAELKKLINSETINEYYDSRKAIKTVAIMKLAQASSNLFSSVESYRHSIQNIATAAEAEQLFSQLEKSFFAFRTEHYRTRWSDMEIKKRLPGGKILENAAKKKSEESD